MIVNEPVPDTFEDTPAKDRDPEWFKRAVFYEVLVRSFQDSNGDGVGDLKGLTAKLDYLQWLGVDCLWLPPFFKSPCATAATTSPTTPRCCPSSVTWPTSSSSWTRPTSAACA
ncbi:hypothetical protein SAVCW2_03430 [Streptomyces avermitilis]|nr:hypothetical protein SAVCW2_03430 [Streptomyces avermitilis]